MKAIVRFWYDASPCLVEGKIENGQFVVTAADGKRTPNVDFKEFETVLGKSHFGGMAFRSEKIGNEYLSTFYLLPQGEVKMKPKKQYSEVVVSDILVRDLGPYPKSDEANDAIFGKENW